jgi:hypothetical protein
MQRMNDGFDCPDQTRPAGSGWLVVLYGRITVRLHLFHSIPHTEPFDEATSRRHDDDGRSCQEAVPASKTEKDRKAMADLNTLKYFALVFCDSVVLIGFSSGAICATSATLFPLARSQHQTRQVGLACLLSLTMLVCGFVCAAAGGMHRPQEATAMHGPC